MVRYVHIKTPQHPAFISILQQGENNVLRYSKKGFRSTMLVRSLRLSQSQVVSVLPVSFAY